MSLVLDREAALVPASDEFLEDRCQVDIANTKLAACCTLAALQVHVRDQRGQLAKRLGATHACALEVHRIEVHPDVGPVNGLEDFPTYRRSERRAVVVFEGEQHAG